MCAQQILEIVIKIEHSHPFTDGQSNADVELITKNYVERESSVTLFCRHNFPLESIYKVSLLVLVEHVISVD